MVLIYQIKNGNIVQYFSGNTSQIGWIFVENPDLVGVIDELILKDEITNPLEKRVINNMVIPKIKVTLEQNESELIVELSDTHATDDVNNMIIPILFGDKELHLKPGIYQLDSSMNVTISVNSHNFISEPIYWEV